MEPRRRNKRADRLSPARAGSETGRAIVIEPFLRRQAPKIRAQQEPHARSPAARLEEMVGLARAIDLDVVGSGTVALSAVTPATDIGKGKVEEIAGLVKSHEAG
ncbi:MAG: GTPase HflX, partial [Xanthobacteraceae bacterium]